MADSNLPFGLIVRIGESGVSVVPSWEPPRHSPNQPARPTPAPTPSFGVSGTPLVEFKLPTKDDVAVE